MIQNESADNVDSDDDHIADADGLSDEAFAEFCAPRTADLQGIPFSTKMDGSEDLDIRMEDLCVHQVTELNNMAMDESSGDVLGHQLSNSPVLEPRSFLPSPSYSPKPAVSPIRIWHDNMDNDSDSDIQEVEQSEYLFPILRYDMLMSSCQYLLIPMKIYNTPKTMKR